MPSLIPGYAYDVFISYRQKDNRGDHWVTEFVEALTTELGATFKEDISIYFDRDPREGLLENHEVSDSLREKVKALVFIPILSRTYCDPKSFAWNEELLPFIKFASHDDAGLKVRIAHGNTASRILPVRIHDLDAADAALFEREAGSMLRPIDFIFRSGGVNRPLVPSDDRRNDSQVYFRDQVNKVANAISEIVAGMKGNVPEGAKPAQAVAPGHTVASPGRRKRVRLMVSTAAIALLVAGAYLIGDLSSFFPKPQANLDDKSIAVMPFTDMSPAQDQQYFSDGMMDEILNQLFKVGELRVTSRTSSMQFRNSALLVPEIAQKLGVAHILEGSVQKVDDRVRIRIQLINARTDEHLWAETFERDMADVFAVQTEIAQNVADVLKVKISADAARRMGTIPTRSPEAHLEFLKIRNSVHGSNNLARLDTVIALDPNYAEAYGYKALIWVYRGGHGGSHSRGEVIANAQPLIDKALSLNPDLPEAHKAMALLSLYYYRDFAAVDREYRKMLEVNPAGFEDLVWFADYLLASRQTEEALRISKLAFENDDNYYHAWIALALSEFYSGQTDHAFNTVKRGHDRFPNRLSKLNVVRLHVYSERYGDAMAACQEYFPGLDDKQRFNETEFPSYVVSYFAIASFKTGQAEKGKYYLDMLNARAKRNPIGSPFFFIASVHAVNGDKRQMLTALENAAVTNEVELYWTGVEPMFRPYHNDPDFRKFVEKILPAKVNQE